MAIALALHAMMQSAVAEPAQTPADAGWTAFARAADARVVYVSSSEGDDRRDGLSPECAVRTASRGYALLRHQHPDWLLFKAGDTFEGGLGHWKKSGRSPSQKMIVGSYGAGPRPRFVTGRRGFIESGSARHVAFVGLHAYADAGDPQSPTFRRPTKERGVFWQDTLIDIHFEDCVFEHFGSGLVFESQDKYTQSGLTLHRCIARNSFGNGLFIAYASDVAIVECVLDHNGWVEGVSPKSMFNHNAYIHSCRNVLFAGNISARASSFGLKIRGDVTGATDGLTIRNNLFLANTNAVSIGGNKKGGVWQPFSTQNLVATGNVFMRMGGVLNDQPQSFGFNVNTVRNARIEGNHFLDKPECGTSCAIKIETWKAPSQNVLIRGNVVHRWAGGTVTGSKGGIVSEANCVDLPASRFVDADRTIETYLQEITGATGSVETFLERAGAQSRHAWDDAWTAQAVNAYIRAGLTLRPTP